MVVVGADVHQRTHTFVAVDEVGRELGHTTFDTTTLGHRGAVRRVRERFGAEARWAIEDFPHLSARLERDLLTAGQSVVRVGPKMMAEQRRMARTRGESDPIDALAVARVAQREPHLPAATHLSPRGRLRPGRWTGPNTRTCSRPGLNQWVGSWRS